MRQRAIISWSGGKDCAWALHEVRCAGELDVVAALTTFSVPADRVSIHDVPADLLRAQWAAAGLRGLTVQLPSPCPNHVYEREIKRALDQVKAAGVTVCIFGDLFLEEIRAYCEARLAPTGIEPAFPLWGRPTPALAREMIDGGIEAVAVCIDRTALPAGLAGRRFDRDFLADLPPGVDSCGENGEFHTLVTAGPMLSGRIPVRVVGIAERDGFCRADLAAAAVPCQAGSAMASCSASDRSRR